MGTKPTDIVEIIYCYAPPDEKLKDELDKQLAVLKRRGLIKTWCDRDIDVGKDWQNEVDRRLNEAQIILLLISSDFLASYNCVKMDHVLERHRRSDARVIPIILRPCGWRDAPFADLPCLPHDGKAVTEWDNQDVAFRDILWGLRRAINQQLPPIESIPRWSSSARLNRLRLLKGVRQTWIEGVLEQSLCQMPLITLDLQDQPDTLHNPWYSRIQETQLSPRPLPAHTPITKVYDDAEGELLILGEPGAGKTTLLLELARDLLNRAEQDETHPLPVIFHLSFWAVKRQPLVEWFIEELNDKYKIPRKFARMWVEDDRLLLLLDGLDEIKLDYRVSFIYMINHYQKDHGLVSLVVCSRTHEYLILGRNFRLQLHRAVVIQPLAEQQIRDAFSGSKSLVDAYDIVHKDSALQNLITTPLMLNVFIRTYREQSFEVNMLTGSLEVRRRQVFALYVQRMLEHRSSVPYSNQQTKQWLTWLAKQMAQRNQIVFFPKQMQSDWLPHELHFYSHVLVALVSGLISGILSGIVIGLLFGLLLGLISGGFVALIFGLLFARDETHRTISVRSRNRPVFIMVSRRRGWELLLMPIILLISEFLGDLVGELVARGVSVGQATLRRVVLYHLLWRAGCIPKPSQYIKFLDFTTERILLRRVGDGYIFVHRLLQDYFASL